MRDIPTHTLPESDNGEVVSSRIDPEFQTREGLPYTVDDTAPERTFSSVGPEVVRASAQDSARKTLDQLGATTYNSTPEATVHPIQNERRTSPEELPLVYTIDTDLKRLVRDVRSRHLFDETPKPAQAEYLEQDDVEQPA